MDVDESDSPAGVTQEVIPLRLVLSKYNESKDVRQIRGQLYAIFTRSEQILESFKPVDQTNFKECVDIMGTQQLYKACIEFDATNAIIGATRTLLEQIKDHVQPLDISQVDVFVIVLQNPLLIDPDNISLVMPKLCQALAQLPAQHIEAFKERLGRSLQQATLGNPKGDVAHIFLQIIQTFQHFITMRVSAMHESLSINKEESIIRATQVLDLFYEVNEELNLIPYYEFYNEAINEQIDIKDDYPKWKGKDGFSYCNHPFILNTSTKGDILKIESMIQMRHELQDSFFRAMFIGVNSPYLQLEVRRDHVIRDALFQLEGKGYHELKKQIRVSFVGEEGIDEGGVQKEFFQLIVKEMFKIDYGMFVTNDLSRLWWFSHDNVSDLPTLEEYGLIGRLIGLAIYNGVVLDIHFPLALYKKLLCEPVDLTDLTEWDPDLGKGLSMLLTFEGDVSEAFQRTFRIEYDVRGAERVSYDLKSDGDNIPVTKENRQEFVDLYVDFVLNSGVKQAFDAFKDGFDSVMHGSALQLFRAEELQELVCGSPNLDFEALEQVAQYDGYEKTTPVIRYFWEVVHDFNEEQKKKLLFFTTGSDRVPVGGLSKLQFIIARNGTDSERLPTSHTCYNVLLLCEYATKERLKERLLTALDNANCGFFLN